MRYGVYLSAAFRSRRLSYQKRFCRRSDAFCMYGGNCMVWDLRCHCFFGRGPGIGGCMMLLAYGKGAQGCKATLLVPLGQGRCGEARPVGGFWQAGSERQVWACKVLFAGRAGVWGLRRTPPAPAQGTRPLRIPLAAALSPMPQHAPDGPCSYAVRRAFSSLPVRNATKNPCPLTRGAGVHRSFAAAPAAGTADRA